MAGFRVEPNKRPLLAEKVHNALHRDLSALPHAIAEIKMRSPSAGVIRSRSVGAVSRIAQSYVAAGAAAVSVLCDGPFFGGTPLDVRRVAQAVTVPVLFKEFVLDTIQVQLAREVGAHMVLLLACALSPSELNGLVDETIHQGLVPLVEVNSRNELEVALQTKTNLIGVNARDLRTFQVDPKAALQIIDLIPKQCLAVYMSGVSAKEDFRRIADSRADAVLMGEVLMRSSDPAKKLISITSL